MPFSCFLFVPKKVDWGIHHPIENCGVCVNYNLWDGKCYLNGGLMKCESCGSSNLMTITKGIMCKDCKHVQESGLYKK